MSGIFKIFKSCSSSSPRHGEEWEVKKISCNIPTHTLRPTLGQSCSIGGKQAICISKTQSPMGGILFYLLVNLSSSELLCLALMSKPYYLLWDCHIYFVQFNWKINLWDVTNFMTSHSWLLLFKKWRRNFVGIFSFNKHSINFLFNFFEIVRFSVHWANLNFITFI